MKKSKLMCIFFISTLILASLSTLQYSVRIQEIKAEIVYAGVAPVDDARVYEGSPDDNFGSSDFMTVGRYQLNCIEMWIRFNLTDVASIYGDLRLKSAVLRLRRRDAIGTLGNVQVQVWATPTGWSESSITWNNKPSLLTNYTLCAFTGDKFSELDYRGVALNKSDVKYWMSSNDKLYSVCLTAQNQSDTQAYFQVSSKESVYAPSLDLYFAPEGAEPNCQVAVLVDTTIQDLNPGYFELFARGVEKWLEWWKMDYEEVDVRTTTITRSLLSRYNLIVIAQFNLTLNGNLDSSELQAINASVYEDGVGLVQLDSYLSGYTDIWSDYDELFGVAIQDWVSSTSKMNLTVVDNTHFITEIYRNGTEMNALFPEESSLVFENVTVGGSAETLVVMPYDDAYLPALVVKSHGNGRVVLSTFSTGRVEAGYDCVDGFGERPVKTNSGMHGLLWRGMAWAAKKPFIFMGMPPFLMFRIENFGLNPDNSYIDTIVEHGYFVHVNAFVDTVNSREPAYINRIKNHYWNGTAQVGVSSWSMDWQIYWDRSGGDPGEEYDSSTLSKYFSWLDGNQTAWNITYSAWLKPAFCAIGENAVPYLVERGWNFASSKDKIPFTTGVMDKWMWYSGTVGAPGRSVLVTMDFADSNNSIFNVFLYLPVNNATYFSPSFLTGAYDPPNVTKATEQMLSQIEHGLADLFWGDAFTHDDYTGQFGISNWDAALTWVTGNLTSQYPFTITVSREYIARYVFNRRHLSISDYSLSSNTLTLNFSGTTSLPVAFYLFTDQKITSYSGILDHFRSYGDNGYLVWIPAYSGSHQVSITLGSSETNNPHLHYTTCNITSTIVSSTAFTIQAGPIWKHSGPKYRFQVNCTSRGLPLSVEVDGVPVSFNYDSAVKLVTFNATFSSLQEIVVSWDARTHDVAVTALTQSRNVVGEGFPMNINVTVQNQGSFTETFNVSTYANTSLIDSSLNNTLTSGNSTTITFTWNTTDFAKGNYTIWAYVTPVTGETDTADNTLVAAVEVCVTIPCDVDADFDVDLYDAVNLLKRYGLTKGEPNYDPNVDIDGNGRIFLGDAVILLAHYGQKDP